MKSVESQPTFRRNISPPSSGSNNLRKRPTGDIFRQNGYIDLQRPCRGSNGYPLASHHGGPVLVVAQHIGFVVDKAALKQVFSEYFGFPCQLLNYKFFHHHNHHGLCRVDPIGLPPTIPITEKLHRPAKGNVTEEFGNH
jgi:hypothetical protein